MFLIACTGHTSKDDIGKELKMLHTEQLHAFCGFEHSEMARWRAR